MPPYTTLVQLKAHLIVLCFVGFFAKKLCSYSASGTREGAGMGGVGQNSAVGLLPLCFQYPSKFSSVDQHGLMSTPKVWRVPAEIADVPD